MTQEPQRPSTEVWLDANSLRGIAHPLRLRLLTLLREHGPSTATALARVVGHSSGVTSYHLRQLAAYGFVEEDATRGTKRDRWWRAAHRTTRYDLGNPDPESAALGDEYLRAVARHYAERTASFLDGTPTLAQEMGQGWTEAWTISDFALALTPESAQRLIAEIEALLDRYPRAVPGRQAEGSERVVVQYQVLPQVYAAPLEEPSS